MLLRKKNGVSFHGIASLIFQTNIKVLMVQFTEQKITYVQIYNLILNAFNFLNYKTDWCIDLASDNKFILFPNFNFVFPQLVPEECTGVK